MSAFAILWDAILLVVRNETFPEFCALVLLYTGYRLTLSHQERESSRKVQELTKERDGLQRDLDQAKRDLNDATGEIEKLERKVAELKSPRQECLRQSLERLRHVIVDFVEGLKRPNDHLTPEVAEPYAEFKLRSEAAIPPLVSALKRSHLFSTGEAERIGFHLLQAAHKSVAGQMHQPLAEAVDALLSDGPTDVLASNVPVPSDWTKEITATEARSSGGAIIYIPRQR